MPGTIILAPANIKRIAPLSTFIFGSISGFL